MTSEKWLNIIEVRPFQLMEYLKSMKEKGYCIVGAEQTSTGKCISDVQLPEKMVLLLGY